MVRVALCQMGANASAHENLKKIETMVEQAMRTEPDLDLICFPEYCYFVPTQLSSQQPAEQIPGKFSEKMSSLAAKYHVNIVAGSFAEKSENGKIFNTSLFFDRTGKLIGKYSKCHLMVAMGADESQHVEYGDHIEVFDTDFGRVGLMVCYDMRFPEQARSMVLQGADILLVPSDFPAGNPLPPRTDHWDTLVQATALLNLTYTIAINQYGAVFNSIPFGRSCVVDPWGDIVVRASNTEQICYGELDLEFQRQVREKIAALNNRRPELYQFDKGR